MRQFVWALPAALLLGGCGINSEIPAEELAIQDYVEVAELPEAKRIRTDRRTTYTELDTNRYVLFKTRKEYFLLEFQRSCWELRDDWEITPDNRVDSSFFYPGVDTLRGCPTKQAWQLNEGQAEEIRTLGDAPSGG